MGTSSPPQGIPFLNSFNFELPEIPASLHWCYSQALGMKESLCCARTFESLNVSDRTEVKATFPAAQDLQVRPKAEDKQ